MDTPSHVHVRASNPTINSHQDYYVLLRCTVKHQTQMSRMGGPLRASCTPRPSQTFNSGTREWMRYFHCHSMLKLMTALAAMHCCVHPWKESRLLRLCSSRCFVRRQSWAQGPSNSSSLGLLQAPVSLTHCSRQQCLDHACNRRYWDPLESELRFALAHVFGDNCLEGPTQRLRTSGPVALPAPPISAITPTIFHVVVRFGPLCLSVIIPARLCQLRICQCELLGLQGVFTAAACRQSLKHQHHCHYFWLKHQNPRQRRIACQADYHTFQICEKAVL